MKYSVSILNIKPQNILLIKSLEEVKNNCHWSVIASEAIQSQGSCWEFSAQLQQLPPLVSDLESWFKWSHHLSPSTCLHLRMNECVLARTLCPR